MNHGFFHHAAVALAALWFAAAATAHPIPDIPVRAAFATGGGCTISVEVDPRGFDADPAEAPSLLHWVFRNVSPGDRAALEQKAGELIRRCVEFYFEPLGLQQPKFVFEFTRPGGGPLEKDEDIVVLTGRWETTLPAGVTGWKIRATPETPLAVVLKNTINGETHPRLSVLFPGETSFTLDLTTLGAAVSAAPPVGAVPVAGSRGDAWSTFSSFFAQGFVHVLPHGLDHILFVLGLFLLSREWRPLLLQVTTFTLAHSVTLVFATLGWVNAPAAVVEPVIAASIAAVALENIFHPRYTHWRLLVVFLFGLVHGLGFAGALSSLDLPPAALASGLAGFNLGVEAGQLAVIALAFLVTARVRGPEDYRRWIAIPGSALIAAMGVWWTVQRTLL